MFLSARTGLKGGGPRTLFCFDWLDLNSPSDDGLTKPTTCSCGQLSSLLFVFVNLRPLVNNSWCGESEDHPLFIVPGVARQYLACGRNLFLLFRQLTAAHGFIDGVCTVCPLRSAVESRIWLVVTRRGAVYYLSLFLSSSGPRIGA